MKRLALFALLATSACKPSGPAGTATPEPTSADSSGVTVALTAVASEYKAKFRTGGAGGMEVPLIPLTVVVKNGGAAPWKCEGAITLSADGERGKRREARAFLMTLSPCQIAPGAEHREELEAGEYLTEVASGFMKGDRLTVRAAVKPAGASAPVTIDVFVPEG